MSARSDPRMNHRLAALPPSDWPRWSSHLESVELPLGAVLKESGRAMRHVVFPTTAVVSLMVLSENGDSTEIAIIGNEGIVGIASLMAGAMTHCAIVQCAGEGFRLKVQAVQDEFARGGPARLILLRNLQAFIAQIQLAAACHRHNSVDQRLCRMLLMCLDRIQGNVLPMTQEQVAGRLGVRRESVTDHALQLRAAGLAHWSRNRITVLDRQGLEHRSCECYAVLRKERDRLLAGRSVVQVVRPIERHSFIAGPALVPAL